MTKRNSHNVPYLYSLGLKNFRGFKSTDINLSPLTFLVGPNSSGKSSLFDAILLIAQNQNSIFPPRIFNLNWIGNLVDLGSFKDTVYRHKLELNIEIKVGYSKELLSLIHEYSKRRQRPIELTWVIGYNVKSELCLVKKVIIKDYLSKIELTVKYFNNKIGVSFLDTYFEIKFTRNKIPDPFLLIQKLKSILKRKRNNLSINKSGCLSIIAFADMYRIPYLLSQTQRVSSGRAAPKRWYPLTAFKEYNKFSRNNPQQVFDSVEPSTIEENSRDYRYYSTYELSKENIKRPIITMNEALKKLNIAKLIEPIKLSDYHSAINLRDNITDVISNITEVGYGASQVIPILKASLNRVVAPLFVEQPEIHLHPKAQGILADLLINTSKYRQVVIETHSVRLINRARLAIARGEIDHRNVQVLYVDRSKAGSFVKKIGLLKNGDFDTEWPDGFFEERYEDTIELLQLKSKK